MMKKTVGAVFVAVVLVALCGSNPTKAEAVKSLPTGGDYQVTCLDYGVEMRDKKTVKSCLLALPGDFPAAGGGVVSCAAKYAAAFGTDGRVEYCTLYADMDLRRTPSEKVSCKAGGRVVLRTDGTLEIATLKQTLQLPYSKKASVICRAALPVSFREDGNVSTCILDQEVLFVSGEKKKPNQTCQAGGLIAFDDDGKFGGCYPPPPVKAVPVKGATTQGGKTE